MIFKKTILALSLSVVSVIAAAAPAAAPAPAATKPVNVLEGAPAYILTGNPWGFTAYTPLIDTDHVQRGGIPQGAWTGRTTTQQIYMVDFTGAPCVDTYGSCAAKPGKGLADVNTVVIYSKQPVGLEKEPTSTTLLDDNHKVRFRLFGYKGTHPGVSLEGEPGDDWEFIAEVKDNAQVKRTINFPTAKYSKFELRVSQNTLDTTLWGGPTITGMTAFKDPAINLPSATIKP